MLDSSLVVPLPKNQDFVPNCSVNQLLEIWGHFFLSNKERWLTLWQIQVWDFKILCNISRSTCCSFISEFPTVPSSSLSVLRNGGQWFNQATLPVRTNSASACFCRRNFPPPCTLTEHLTSLLHITAPASAYPIRATSCCFYSHASPPVRVVIRWGLRAPFLLSRESLCSHCFLPYPLKLLFQPLFRTSSWIPAATWLHTAELGDFMFLHSLTEGLCDLTTLCCYGGPSCSLCLSVHRTGIDPRVINKEVNVQVSEMWRVFTVSTCSATDFVFSFPCP